MSTTRDSLHAGYVYVLLKLQRSVEMAARTIQQAPVHALYGLARRSVTADTRSAEDRFQPIKTWTEPKEEAVLAPYTYLAANPGKNVRSQLIKALNVWLRVPPESLAIIEHVVGMLHTSSLLIDDIEDGSPLRRGKPSAHIAYGIPQTINSANYVYFLALQEVQKLKNPACARVFTEELIELHRGQGLDLVWRDTFTCPSEQDYVDMVSRKTGGLFRLAVRLMAEESRAKIDLVELTNLLGVIFQIRDDYLNLSPEYTMMKGYCEDLTEGKFSFPVIHSIKARPDDTFILDVLREKAASGEETKRKAVAYMRDQTQTFAYTKAYLGKLGVRVQDEIARLNRVSGIRNKPMEAIVVKLLEFLEK